MSPRRLELRTRGFGAFLLTQFLGAFNDNAFKFTLLALITYTSASEAQEGRHTFAAQVLFAAPFVVLAAFAGSVADRHRKSSVMIAAKVAEIVVMVAGVAAFLSGSIGALLVVLFAMSVQSTMFGPAKYGYLGECVAEGDLSAANALVAMTTFLAIIAGSVVGPLIFERFEGRLEQGAAFFVVMALAGWIASLGLQRFERTGERPPLAIDPRPQLLQTWRGIRADKTLLYTVGGIVHFYLLGAALQVELLDFGHEVMDLDPTAAGTLPGTAAVGIVLGSLLAGRWSQGQIELGLVPLGTGLLSASVLALAFVGGPPSGGFWNAVPPYACVLVAGVSGGLFVVPLQAMMQHRAPEGAKGRYLAFMNAASFVGVALAGVVNGVPRVAGLDPRGRAFLIGLVSLAGAVVSFRVLPLAFARFCAWLAARTLYRIRVLHPERLPATGGALIVSNHVSWVDWLILVATTRRHIHFLIQREYYEWWTVNWLFRMAGLVPVAAGDPPEKLAASLADAGRLIEQGEIVAIFVEGTVTRTGNMLSVRTGYRRIVAGRDVPVIPAHIDGLWGSMFSHSGGRLLWKMPRWLGHPVTVTYGEPLDADAEPHEVRGALQALSTEAWGARRRHMRPAHVELLARSRFSLRRDLRDAGGRALSRGALVAEALSLRDALADRLAPARHVAIVGEPGLSSARAVLAVLYAGGVPVPLDPALGAEALAEILQRHRIGTVLAAAPHVARVPAATVIDADAAFAALPVGAAALWRRRLTWCDERTALRRAMGRARPDVDAALAVLFSSGSTDVPKGVTLSHFAVTCNVHGLLEVLDPSDEDLLLATSPLSSAFGFTVGLWLPLLSDVGVVWCDQPQDGRAVGRAVERHGATMLMASPRHLEAWLHGARPQRLGGVRYAMAVGARLVPALRADFRRHFGIEPVECYGATECAAIIALNTPDVRQMGVFQRGTKEGTVGHPLPGVTVEVVDPDSGARLPEGVVGVLRVRGASLMTGYLDAPERSAAVLVDGWYVSGDLGSVDRDGFVTLVGRSYEIGGERVPLQAVELAILEVLGAADAPVAVLASPDRKGRHRLVVAHERDRLQPRVVVKALRARGMSRTWIPDVKDFVAVDRLPLTGAGLVDFQALRRLISRPY